MAVFPVSNSLASEIEVKEPHLDTVTVQPFSRSSNDIFDIVSRFISAKSAYDSGNYSQSFYDYSTLTLYDPDNKQALLGLGNSALALNKNDIALKAFNQLDVSDLSLPEKTVYLSGTTIAKSKLGKTVTEETDLKQALTLSPKDTRLWNALGQYYDQQSRWTESCQAYQSAHKVGFSASGLNNNLGMSLLKQKKYSDAAHYFSKAVKLSPHKTKYDNNRRFALLMNGEYVQALENLAPQQAADVLCDAGLIAQQRDELELAQLLLKKAIEVSPVHHQRAISALTRLITIRAQ